MRTVLHTFAITFCLAGCGSRTGLDLLGAPGVDAGESEGAVVPQACGGPVGEVETLATAPGPWMSLAVGATDVYGIIGGDNELSVVAVPRCAGASPVVVGSTADGFPALATGAWKLAQGPAGVYWVATPQFGNGDTVTLSTVSASGATSTLASLGPYAGQWSFGPGLPEASVPLAVGSSDVYVALPGCADAPCDSGNIVRVPLDGTPPTALASWPLPVAYLAADASQLYWTSYSPTDGTIVTMPIGGGPVTTLVPSGPYPVFLTVQGGALYWWEPTGAVMTVPASGGTPTALATGMSTVSALAVDVTNVYLSTGGSIVAIPLTGGAMRTLGPGGTAIAVDGTNVYWDAPVAGSATQSALLELKPQ